MAEPANTSKGLLYAFNPLHSIKPKDVAQNVASINTMLDHYGLSVDSVATVPAPVNGNVFATASAAALLLAQLGDGDSVNDDALAMDLIGCLSGEDARTVTILRPLLHKVRDAYLRQGKAADLLTASDLKLFEDHLNTLQAGTLKRFVTESEGKLGGWLAQANALAQGTLQALTLPATFINTTPVSQSTGQIDDWYQPEAVHPSLWVALQGVLPSSSDDKPKGISWVKPTVNPTLMAQVTQGQARLAMALPAQAGGQEGTVAFYLNKLKEKLAASEEVAKTTAVVEGHQARIVVEKKEGWFEALPELSPTQCGPNQCKAGGPTDSGCAIGFAMGDERISQADFELPGIVPLSWHRTYRSNLISYDKGPMGARWVNQYLTRIDVRQQEWLFNTADGRMVSLPKLKVGEVHRDGVNGYNLVVISDEVISLTFGREAMQLFQKQGKHYKPVLFRDSNHNSVSLTYDRHHRLESIANHTNQHGLSFDYDEHKRIKTVWLSLLPNHERLRIVAEYQYDQQNNLVSAVDEAGDERTFAYDAHHRVTRYTDRTGHGMNLTWAGRRHKAKAVHEQADDGSRALSLSWQSRLRGTSVMNGLGQSGHFFVDAEGYPVRNILPDGREEWFFRDEQKNITKHLSADGRATSMTYDWKGNVLSVTQNDSSKTFFEYNDQDQMVKTIDANGQAWRNQYDGKGNLSKSFDPKGRITQYEYNDQGLLTKVIDARGGVNTLEYNDVGQLIKQTDCSQQSSTYDYDGKGQLLKTEDAKAHQLAYDYNERGQVTKATYPDGKFTQYAYDAEGRLLYSKDSLSRTHKIGYDQGFQPFLFTDSIGRQLSVQRDRLGRVTQLTDANGAHYTWRFHPVTGQLQQETNFAGKSTHYQYDAQTGELISKQEDGGDAIQYGYDELGRMVSRRCGTQLETYAYDSLGQLLVAENGYSKIDYAYDEVGQLCQERQTLLRLSESTPDQPVHQAYEWRYEYDVLGNLVTTIRPDGQRIDALTYGSGHIHSLLLNQEPLIDYERDALHREVARYYPNQINQQRQFSPEGYLTQSRLRGAVTQTKDYRYNPQGLISQIIDPDAGPNHYEYDLVGRLTRAQSQELDERFAYDPADNRIDPLAQKGQGRNDHHAAEAQKSVQPHRLMGNLLHSYAGKHYEYDQRGNLIKKTDNGKETTYEWDELNRLIKLSNVNGVSHYRYDVFGRRIYKRTPKTESYYLWEGDDLAMVEGQNKLTHYVFEPGSFAPLAQFVSKGKGQTERLYYYHNDHLGTPDLMSDDRGEVVWGKAQTAFGLTQPKLSAQALLDGISNPIRFQGQYHDEESGLHYNRFRYYDPEIGRYLSEDPIKLAGGLNLYDYPTDPVHGVDPLGLIEWTGTAYNVGVGPGEAGWYDLQSPCLNGKRTRVRVRILGGSKGKGLALGAVGSNVTFEDGLDYVDPNVFNGLYTSGNAGLSFFKGIGFGSIKIGRAESKGLFTIYNRGHLASVAASAGYSEVTSSYTEGCRPPGPPLTAAQKAEQKRLTEEGMRIQEEMKRNGQIPNVPPMGQWFPRF